MIVDWKFNFLNKQKMPTAVAKLGTAFSMERQNSAKEENEVMKAVSFRNHRSAILKIGRKQRPIIIRKSSNILGCHRRMYAAKQ